MPADGFTKLLPRQKHENFIRQLGLKDIYHLIVKNSPHPVPLADSQHSELGMKDDKAKTLALYLSKAVDYAKSGKEVNLVRDVLSNPKFAVSAKPDFLRPLTHKAFLGRQGEYHESQGLLGRLYRQIGAVQYDAPRAMENASIHTKLNPLFSEFRNFKHPQFGSETRGSLYQAYITTQRVHPDDEVDLFLRKAQDNFPNPFVLSLVRGILEIMSSRDVLRKIPGEEKHVCLHDPDGAKAFFRNCLFYIWTFAGEQCDGRHSRDGEEWHGHSYAWLCLYALYCEKLPFEIWTEEQYRAAVRDDSDFVKAIEQRMRKLVYR
ncbi:hypothetical protein CC86DRAFT_410313 [Ophiobolus disseminans]|uniref:RNA-dependent RNA polymerase n=1 Tax=Ophiobolus disseminans TaxID=1469910 RepID=A0A6A6ZLH1_9PLEO|nr:hypothetical protein CC86DRAFT_410313 [Ophiobolus disseminans]